MNNVTAGSILCVMEHFVATFPNSQGVVLYSQDDSGQAFVGVRGSNVKRGRIFRRVEGTPFRTDKATEHLNPSNIRLARNSSIDHPLLRQSHSIDSRRVGRL